MLVAGAATAAVGVLGVVVVVVVNDVAFAVDSKLISYLVGLSETCPPPSFPLPPPALCALGHDT